MRCGIEITSIYINPCPGMFILERILSLFYLLNLNVNSPQS